MNDYGKNDSCAPSFSPQHEETERLNTSNGGDSFDRAVDVIFQRIYEISECAKSVYFLLDRVKVTRELGEWSEWHYRQLLSSFETMVRNADNSLRRAQELATVISGIQSLGQEHEGSWRKHRTQSASAWTLVELASSTVVETPRKSPGRIPLGQILIESRIVAPEQLSLALAEQSTNPRRRLGEILVQFGFVDDKIVAQALGTQFGMAFIELTLEDIDPAAVNLLRSRVADRHNCIPVHRTNNHLFLAMANPVDLTAIEDVERATGLTVTPLVATTTNIENVRARFYADNGRSSWDCDSTNSRSGQSISSKGYNGRRQ